MATKFCCTLKPPRDLLHSDARFIPWPSDCLTEVQPGYWGCLKAPGVVQMHSEV